MRVRSSLCPRLVEGFQEGHRQSCRRCALSHRACVCAERVCTQRGCAYIVCGFCHVRRAGSGLGLGSIPEETRPYSDPWAGRKGGGCGCWDFSPAEKGFPLG